MQFRKENEITKMAAKEKLSSLTLVQFYQDAIICSHVCHCASTVSSGAVSQRRRDNRWSTLSTLLELFGLRFVLNAFFHIQQKLLKI